MGWCESHKEVYYRFGLSTKQRLRRIIAPKLGKLQHDIAHENLGLPIRGFTEFSYTTLDSWSRKRRVVAKLEVLEKGENPRFIVTNLPVSAARWKTGSKNSRWTCAPTGPAPTGWRATSCGSGSVRPPIC